VTLEPNTSSLDRARDAFVTKLHFVLDLAAKRDDRLTRKEVQGLLLSLEVHLDEYLKHLLNEKEVDSR
jgi:hypothetical protein